MTNRTRKHHLEYVRHIKQVGEDHCEFCSFSLDLKHVLNETVHFWIVENIFPYDVWDSSGVKKHLMIVPKRHVDSIAHFNNAESKEYVTLLSQYEAKGFSIYARAPGNTIKSVRHQHTHLIAIDNKIKKFLLFIRSPRLFFTNDL